MARREHALPSMSVIESSALARNLGRRTDLTNRRVLLMVRDQDSAARYEHLFKLFGAKVISVFSAAALFDELRTGRPDALACDLDSPDGALHLIRRIRMRSRLEGGGTPALAMTSAPAASAHTKALLAGFQAYVEADPLDLLLAVARLLGDRAEPN